MNDKINDLYSLAEQEGILVLCFPMQGLEAVSCIDGQGRCAVGIDPKQLKSSVDEREKLAHELGHCLTGAFYNPYSPLDSRARHEQRARRRALEMLVPRAELLLAMAETRDIYELAERFSVGEDTMRLALLQLRESQLSGQTPCVEESFS